MVRVSYDQKPYRKYLMQLFGAKVIPISTDIMGLQAAYANVHTDHARDSLIQRYHDVISSFGGKTSYDADNRLLLVMRSNRWASGDDVDGTDQTSLGQFSGRIQQTCKDS